MSFVKSVVSHFMPETRHTVYSITTTNDFLATAGAYQAMEQIVKALADKYVEDFGDEILKQIQHKTIEQKVIQKVIENLRKEIKKP